MALFSMNRYMGEDDLKSSQSEKILAKIKADAEKRKVKRKSQELSHKSQEKSQVQEDNDKKERKRKKTKDAIDSPSKKKKRTDNDCEMCGEDVEEKDGKKKIKRTVDISVEKISKRDESRNNSEKSEEKKNFKKEKDKHLIDNMDECVSPHESKEMEVSRTADLSDGKEEEEEVEDIKLGEGSQEVGGFTVLGDYRARQNKKVKRLLPDWLAKPSIMSSDLKQTTVPVSHITELHPSLVQKLIDNNISHFFPVQIQVIPELLNSVKYGFMMGMAGFRPRDLCVSAPTGSGKTLAFVLPIIQALMNRVECKIRALVVLPVRELATQVYKVFQIYCKGTKLKVGLVTGQKLFAQEQQTLVIQSFAGAESLVDIIVATPGRLVDHINKTQGFDLSGLRFLVIDEADKMMEQIKQDWLLQVEESVYSKGREEPGALNVHNMNKFLIPLQKLLFSATLSQNPEKLQQLNLFQPKLFTSVDEPAIKPVDIVPRIDGEECERDDKEPQKKSEDLNEKMEIKQNMLETLNKSNKSPTINESGDIPGKYTTPAGLSELYMECTAAEKPLLILHFLLNLKFNHVLCFTNSVESAHRLYHVLRLVGGIKVQEITAKINSARITKTLQKFAKGNVDILICSDAMARGIDVDSVKYVISYDPPPFIKTYIHRVGRTARAGKAGTAITLIQKKEFFHFKKMTREAGKSGLKKLKVARESLQPIVPSFESALQELPQVLKAEKLKQREQR